MYRELASFCGGGFNPPPPYEEIRQEFRRRHRPAYLYANGVVQPFFWKFQTWRRTGEYACFYRQRLTGPFGTNTETYVWVLRNGRFHEVSQQGVRGVPKRKCVRW